MSRSSRPARSRKAKVFRQRRILFTLGADRAEAKHRDEVHLQRLADDEKERRNRERRLADAERKLEAARQTEAKGAATAALIAYRKDLEDLVAQRERELRAYAGVMVTIPRPEPARQIRRKPDDEAIAWSKAARGSSNLTPAQIRKLNGLD